MPFRLFLSSGDLIADRRYEFARDLQLKGDLAAAAEVMEQAIEVAPTFASAWFELGKIRLDLGETDKAIAAFQNAVAADPDDRHGAHVRLMQLGAVPLGDMPKAYVTSLFDQYAPRFEAELIERLNYRAPAILFKAVIAVRAAEKKPAYFRRAIDLGCGTGLGAAAFAKNVDSIIGVDLSSGMIAQARATGLYAELHVDDMTSALQKRPDGAADLVLAADVMVYVGDLGPVLREGHRVLARGGLLTFTVETHDGDGVIMGKGLRYAHAAEYISGVVASAGLQLAHLEPVSPRTEDQVPVRGLAVVAARI
ncbi:methyltransferase [Bradyrhizobium sp. SSBR45G]|uniref:class I SAM-dependent DNA methyltransferase n=1 Tax=unclassified Bradyrhizobium TaxID=2631580 RepID=UPI002342A9D4|nr:MULTISPECIES: methyltransferase domain-containing protein [unclassified Bradyrhizobium]GLH78642.1 methyltransferase [Bradyrhizobium sp. SSBR45G]GLH87530.1 methyltransferase [Bradyrhizobium sp. SSBR45R]